MSEAVENDTLGSNEPASLVDAAEPALAEGEYFLTEGIKGTGDTPEWYKSEKYKSVADQAKAYTELEKSLAVLNSKGDYAMPEGVEEGDELMEALKVCTETNMNQDSFDEAWDLLIAQSEAVEEVSAEMNATSRR